LDQEGKEEEKLIKTFRVCKIVIVPAEVGQFFRSILQSVARYGRAEIRRKR
jgi:hypothetical protein